MLAEDEKELILQEALTRYKIGDKINAIQIKSFAGQIIIGPSISEDEDIIEDSKLEWHDIGGIDVLSMDYFIYADGLWATNLSLTSTLYDKNDWVYRFNKLLKTNG
jgi:hypothetical protein